MVFVRRPIAQIMNVELEDSIFLCAFHHTLAQWRAADFRKQCDDVDLHLEQTSDAQPASANATARQAPNVQRRIVAADYNRVCWRNHTLKPQHTTANGQRDVLRLLVAALVI